MYLWPVEKDEVGVYESNSLACGGAVCAVSWIMDVGEISGMETTRCSCTDHHSTARGAKFWEDSRR